MASVSIINNDDETISVITILDKSDCDAMRTTHNRMVKGEIANADEFVTSRILGMAARAMRRSREDNSKTVTKAVLPDMKFKV